MHNPQGGRASSGPRRTDGHRTGKISPPLLRQELRRDLTLNRYMDPDAAEITPAGRQPNR